MFTENSKSLSSNRELGTLNLDHGFLRSFCGTNVENIYEKVPFKAVFQNDFQSQSKYNGNLFGTQMVIHSCTPIRSMLEDGHWHELIFKIK